jgi:Asp-tRNAAsn/Glu-tRNAGln amidotransferase A subunit and related amidases
MSELWRKGAVELAAMIRDREVSSREVVQAHLDRIEAGQPSPQRHRSPAGGPGPRGRRRGRPGGGGRRSARPAAWRPVHGQGEHRPGGHPDTHAIPALAEAVASVDAPQVERLRAAGAIPLGRTNLPDFGLRVHTDSLAARPDPQPVEPAAHRGRVERRRSRGPGHRDEPVRPG